MIFNDYLTVMLANMVAGLVVAALFTVFGLAQADHRAWAAALGAAGLVATACGLHMTLTWPLKPEGVQWANVAFGEMALLFGVVYLAAALASALRWSLLPVGIYAVVVGVFAIVVGICLMHFGLSKAPAVTMVGFVSAGIGAILLLPAIHWRHLLPVRLAAAAAMALSAAVWTVVGIGAYASHLKPS
jgi:uncharacterized membrane protein